MEELGFRSKELPELGEHFVNGRNTGSDGFLAAVELEGHDITHRGLDEDVWWVEGEFATGDLILDEAEGTGEHIEDGKGLGILFLRCGPALEGIFHGGL